MPCRPISPLTSEIHTTEIRGRPRSWSPARSGAPFPPCHERYGASDASHHGQKSRTERSSRPRNRPSPDRRGAVPTRVRPPTVREWGAGLVVRLRLAGGGTASHYSVDDRRRGFADLPVVWTADCGGFAARPVKLLGLFRPTALRL